MLHNKLTFAEFKSLLMPIIKLEEIRKTKEIIYGILHFTKVSANDNRQCFINSETTGINSTYQGFAINIRRLHHDRIYTGTVIQFYREKRLPDIFLNPTKRLISDIRRVIKAEIPEFDLTDFYLLSRTLEGKGTNIITILML